MAKRGGFPGGAMPGNMANLMKQAQRMQRQMEVQQAELEKKQAELSEKEFKATAGGGAIEVTVKGGALENITISKDAVDPDDVEMLQDLIMAAVNDALKQSTTAQEELQQSATDGMNLGGFGF